MAKLVFKNGIVEDYTIVLSTRDFRHLGQITGIRSVNNVNNLNSANELSFTICKYDLLKYNESSFIDYKTHLKIKNDLWKQIVDLKLVWIKELNEYFEIKVSINDSLETTKAITATALCEAELSQTETGIIEINTEADIEREDYEVTTFCNMKNPKASLLHRVLDKAPHYTIKHVDASLMNLQRTFSIDSTIYDFLTGECSEQFNCLFVFNSAERGIYVYDLYTVCKDCGERGEFYDECPECGSTDLKYFGKDTTILVDKNNLTDSIQLETNVDSIKNCFKLVAGDDLMTATIRMLNPNGSDYIYYFSKEQKEDMPKELGGEGGLLDSYDELVASYDEEYKELVNDIYELTDDILYLESGMMPSVETVSDISDIVDPRPGIIYLCGNDVYVYDGTELVLQDEDADFYTNLIPSSDVISASSESKKLTVENLSPLGLSSVTTSTYVATVNSALKNYAKVYVKTGYVKLEVSSDATFEYVGIDEDGYNYGTWYGYFTVTNYSDEEDVVTTDYMSITVCDNYEEFTRQKILKVMALEDDEEGSVFDVLAIDELEAFKKALTLYGKNRLKSFYDAIQGALDVLIQMDQATEYADLYDILYVPYYDKLQACQAELDKRQLEVDAVQAELNSKDQRRLEIQNALNFKEYLGEYYNTFCAYRREQKYTNDNYISDGLSNVELIERALEFIETVKKELVKSGELQYTISSTLNNLLVLPEFKPIVENFELGNWIRVKIDGSLYRLRLIGYTINFDNLQTISVEFSTVTKIKDVAYEAQQIINSAQSMASSYGYVSKQAEKGKEANESIDSIFQNGFNSGLVQIKNNDKEEITYGKNGLLCRSWDDITETYDPKQLKLTHNVIAFTKDNWKTCCSVIGEHNYEKYNSDNNTWISDTGYGVTTEFVTSGHVYGSSIVGGKVWSTKYSDGTNGRPAQGTFIDLDEGSFSFAGGRLTYDGDDTILLNNVTINWGTVNTPDIENMEGLNDIVENMNQSLNDMNDSITTLYTGLQFTSISDQYVISPNIVGGQLSIVGTDGTTSASINSQGFLKATGANITGTITATDGTFSGTVTSTKGNIGGWELSSNGFSSDMTMTLSEMTSSDVSTIQQLANNSINYTDAYLEKYDLNKDGIISVLDMLIATKLSGNLYSQYKDCVGSVNINPNDFTNTLVLQSTSGALGIQKTRIGVGSIETNCIKCSSLNASTSHAGVFAQFDSSTGKVSTGIDGTFTIANVGTLTFKGGILVGYSS